MIKRRGLAFKLSFYILTAVLVVLFALLYYNYIITRNLALDDAKKDAQTLTELTIARIENILIPVQNIPENIVSIVESKDTIERLGLRSVLEKIILKDELIYGAAVAMAPIILDGDTFYNAPYLYAVNDSLILKNLAGEDYNYTEQAWYRLPKELGRAVWSEPYFDKGGGDIMMATYAVPIYLNKDGNKHFAGVVTTDISLHSLQQIIHSIQIFKSGFAFLISSSGNIVTHPKMKWNDSLEVHNIFEKDHSAEMQSVIRKMLGGEEGIMSLRGIGAEQRQNDWISYGSLSPSGWSLAVIFHEDELYRSIHNLYLKLIGIGIIGFLIIALLIFVISKRFVKPIEKLAFATRKIGAGEFDFQIPSFGSSDEISQLGDSFRIMQQELQEYIIHLKETTAQKEKMESELQIASSIQQQMLPAKRTIPGGENLDYFGILRPARSVGGDLYDFVPVDEYLYIAIGDVSGKGIPAALFMAKTLTLFRAKLSGGKNPGLIAAEINRDLEQYNEQSMFVTFFIGKLHMKTGELQYTNAGHNLPCILRSGGDFMMLKGTHGLPLGSFAEQDYGTDTVLLSQKDKLVMFTDGIPEAVNMKNEAFGEDRLKDVLLKYSGRKPDELASLLLAEVDAFASGTDQFDDITLFIIEFNQ
ncbi:MAG: SpoIIE family protein phosphatase [Bacteroidales bacterium]|nr:SpoIIE family protein phosphatase [Bacteroidales bacterium]